MIQIDRHIEILLLDNDCVIVPGLGGFMAHHVAARYCHETMSYIPPQRALGFNAQLKINDSLLAQSYIEAYDISYPEALQRIEGEVNELKQTLANEGYCELNDIGRLQLNEEGNIEFIPCEAGILTPSLYALDRVEVAPLSATAATSVTQKPQRKHALLPASAEEDGKVNAATDDAEPVAAELPAATAEAKVDEIADEESTEKDNIREKALVIPFSTIRRVAVAASVIAAVSVIALPLGLTYNKQFTESIIDTSVLYRIMPKALVTPRVEKNDETPATKTERKVVYISRNKAKTAAPSASNATSNASEPQKTVNTNNLTATTSTATVSDAQANKAEEKPFVKEETPKEYYSIVLASCVTKKNAAIFVDDMAKHGFNEAKVIDRSNGAKIVYGNYRSEEDARKALKGLRDKSEAFAEGWIMKIG